MQRISDDWWIGIDDSYRTRVEDGSLVFWRSERTIWINIWKDHDGRTVRERLDTWIADRHAGATDLFQQEDNGLLRFGYLLEEPEDAGGQRLGVYSYTVSETYTVQMACYFDLKEDLGWATAVSKSLSFGRPEPGLKVEEPVGENGHLVLASERVIGPERRPRLARLPRARRQRARLRLAVLPRRRGRGIHRRPPEHRPLPPLDVPRNRPRPPRDHQQPPRHRLGAAQPRRALAQGGDDEEERVGRRREAGDGTIDGRRHPSAALARPAATFLGRADAGRVVSLARNRGREH